MVVHMFHGYNVIKCYVVPLRESNSIAYRDLFTDKNKLSNKLIFQPRVLQNLLAQIGGDSHEVSLKENLKINFFRLN